MEYCKQGLFDVTESPLICAEKYHELYERLRKLARQYDDAEGPSQFSESIDELLCEATMLHDSIYITEETEQKLISVLSSTIEEVTQPTPESSAAYREQANRLSSDPGRYWRKIGKAMCSIAVVSAAVGFIFMLMGAGLFGVGTMLSFTAGLFLAIIGNDIIEAHPKPCETKLADSMFRFHYAGEFRGLPRETQPSLVQEWQAMGSTVQMVQLGQPMQPVQQSQAMPTAQVVPSLYPALPEPLMPVSISPSMSR